MLPKWQLLPWGYHFSVVRKRKQAKRGPDSSVIRLRRDRLGVRAAVPSLSNGQCCSEPLGSSQYPGSGHGSLTQEPPAPVAAGRGGRTHRDPQCRKRGMLFQEKNKILVRARGKS